MADATPEAPGTEPSSRRNRRDARRARTHRRRRQVLVIAFMIVAVAAGTAVATDSVRIGGRESPSLSRTEVSVDATRAPNSTSTTVPRLQCRGGLTSTTPLKLWVGGDSLAGALGPALGAISGETGVVQPYFHSRVSSGLSNPGFVDWPALATKEMASVSPEVVVFIIGANDWAYPQNKTVDTASGEPAWKGTYRRAVEQMLGILEGSERIVLWLDVPALKDTVQNDGIKEINAVTREVTKDHEHTEYVDDYSLFVDKEGKYTQTVVDETGKTIVARSGDGVHFTVDGANYLAHAVFKELDEHCNLTAQRVAGAAKTTIQTAGSTQVAPGSGSSSGGSVNTTPPATAPPATAPPATTSAPAATAPPTTAAPTTTTTTTTNPQPST